MKNIMSSKKESGFSLVELLVVIAVIGLIAAIAIPQISKITDKAQIASDQRNGQNIVSVYGAALAAGASFSAGTTKTDIIGMLETGVPGTGTFATSTFKISPLSDLVQGRVENYIEWVDGTPPTLGYLPEP